MKQLNDKTDELWDLYDENRILTGKVHKRGEPMKEGEYHLVIHVCIFNHNNELLIQQRQPYKSGWPNMWDVTVGGSAVSGDTSQKAAERELFEELGLKVDLTGVRPYFTIHFANGFDDYYFIEQEVDISKLVLQEEEVQRVKWVSEQEMMQMVQEGIMIPHFILDKLFLMKKYACDNSFRFSNIEVKRASLQNLASCMSLAEVAKWDSGQLQKESTKEIYKKNLKRHIEDGTAVCVLDRNMVIGFLLYSAQNFQICDLAIHVEYQTQMIAAKLFQYIAEHENAEKRAVKVTVKVDRPKGSYHPKEKDLYYPINYGYVEGIIAGDGEEQDVYILGVETPVEQFTGKIIAIVHRNNDKEDKWVVCPENMIFSREEIQEKIQFQEQYFESWIECV